MIIAYIIHHNIQKTKIVQPFKIINNKFKNLSWVSKNNLDNRLQILVMKIIFQMEMIQLSNN